MQLSFEEQGDRSIKLKKSWQAYSKVLDKWERSDILERKGYRVLLLGNDNSLIGKVILTDISQLKLNHLSVIKRILLKNNAASIILAENDLDTEIIPSSEERHEVQSIKDLSDQLNLVIKDHLIVARDAYYSYGDNKLIYSPL